MTVTDTMQFRPGAVTSDLGVGVNSEAGGRSCSEVDGGDPGEARPGNGDRLLGLRPSKVWVEVSHSRGGDIGERPSTAVAFPPGVVTTTSAGPAVPAGTIAVIWVSESTLKLVTGTPPTVTAVAPVRPGSSDDNLRPTDCQSAGRVDVV